VKLVIVTIVAAGAEGVGKAAAKNGRWRQLIPGNVGALLVQPLGRAVARVAGHRCQGAVGVAAG